MSSKILYNTKDMVRKKEISPKQVSEVTNWIATILSNPSINEENLFNKLKDGVILCEIVNKIKPETCKKYKESKIAFICRTNIQIFINGCKKLGVPQTDVFETRDLYDKHNLSNVLNTCYSLSSISRKHNFGGPFIGVKYHNKNVRKFDEKTLAKSKSSVPMWNQGDLVNKTKNIDAYGIVKTRKSEQKHTGTLSIWEKGSNLHETKSMDGVGIVKVDKKMQVHSGTLSTWEKGAIDSSKNYNGVDKYGIVKDLKQANEDTKKYHNSLKMDEQKDKQKDKEKEEEEEDDDDDEEPEPNEIINENVNKKVEEEEESESEEWQNVNTDNEINKNNGDIEDDDDDF